MASIIAPKVEGLYTALREETEKKRLNAGDIMRSLVKAIVLTPENDELHIDVRGDLAGIPTLATNTKNPAAIERRLGRRAA
ncbi:hypothetical protein C5L14_24940 [Labrys okinawensis]|uniref:Uncharacterized protein n=2 Tax=Labrys okinawensis TaxID=346911 RepID=A0A2S9Q611_9HYPH|nr:hypothetical protein C5L14_24940 [Labrys okinawensis]